MSVDRFTPVDPQQLAVLTYPFASVLPAGVSLSGSPTVQTTVVYGVDPGASAIVKNIQIQGSSVLVAIGGCLDKTDYDIKVICPTTDPYTNMVWGQILPCRAL